MVTEYGTPAQTTFIRHCLDLTCDPTNVEWELYNLTVLFSCPIRQKGNLGKQIPYLYNNPLSSNTNINHELKTNHFYQNTDKLDLQ